MPQSVSHKIDDGFSGIGAKPISSDHPSGSDARYDDDFEKLEAELAKLESLAQESVDWHKVISLSSTILETKSKHLLVAAYLTRALYEIQGYSGLATGLKILNEMCQNYWPDLFPPIKRLRARASAILWLAEKIGAQIENKEAVGDEIQNAATAAQSLEALNSLLVNKMGDQAPMLANLSRPLKRYQQAATENLNAPPTVTAPPPAEPKRPASAPVYSQNEPEQKITNDTNDIDTTLGEHVFLNIGHTAVSADKPAGSNARYDADFETLDAEIGKLESLTNDRVDWQVVVKLATQIIQSSSKDLLAGAYLCRALFETEGYKGLAVGLKIILDMLETHWANMFPPIKRLRARASAMQWLAEKTAPLVEQHIPNQDEIAATLVAEQLLRKINNLLLDNMADQAPMMNALMQPLKRYKQNHEQNKAAAAQTPAPQTSAQTGTATDTTTETASEPKADSPAEQTPLKTARMVKKTRPATNTASTPIEIGKEADAKNAVRQLQEQGRKIASFWQTTLASDPRPFRINRSLLWLMIEQLPPHVDGVTQVAPPPEDRSKQINDLFEKQQFSALIKEAEKTLARAPFWLDGHRLVASSLQALGSEYDNARQAVNTELGHLLRRLPKLMSLKFSNDSPFADEQTKMWISSEVLTTARTGNNNDTATPWNEALKEVSAQAATKDGLEKAITVMKTGTNSATGEREKSYWRIATAELLLQSGKIDAATASLEAIAEQIERNNLNQWDPALAIHLYGLLYKGYQQMTSNSQDKKGQLATSPVLSEKLAHAYAQLCWHDPQIAIDIKENIHG